jgi:crotonobetainyl-CoA:carnitine CoA-transferase CaiB-like acyl-CoA transferase
MHAIDTIIAGWTERFGDGRAARQAARAGVPAGLVYEPKDMLADPHFTARRSIETSRTRRHGELTMQAVVPRLSETPGESPLGGPALGADTDAVLTDLLGLTADAVAALREDGVMRVIGDGGTAMTLADQQDSATSSGGSPAASRSSPRASTAPRSAPPRAR